MTPVQHCRSSLIVKDVKYRGKIFLNIPFPSSHSLCSTQIFLNLFVHKRMFSKSFTKTVLQISEAVKMIQNCSKKF